MPQFDLKKREYIHGEHPQCNNQEHELDFCVQYDQLPLLQSKILSQLGH